jgi:diguanylate cyclase (GGDEF)-like protein
MGFLSVVAVGGLFFGWLVPRRKRTGLSPFTGDLLAQSSEDGVLVLDERGRVIYCNPAAQDIFGAETLLERPLAELLAIWWQPALQFWEEGQTDFECLLRSEPQPNCYRLRCLPLPVRRRGRTGGHATEATHLIILSDLSVRRRLERRLAALETTDALTGLANRPRLLEIAAREVYRARRYHRALSVLMVQVDDFSVLNDQFGYAAGEQVLVALAQRCRDNIRMADSLGRWGEDTFALLLPETGLEQGHLAAERIRRILSGLPISTERGEVNVTLSTGVAALSEASPVAADQLLDQAAGVLFAARNGQVSSYSWIADRPPLFEK